MLMRCCGRGRCSPCKTADRKRQRQFEISTLIKAEGDAMTVGLGAECSSETMRAKTARAVRRAWRLVLPKHCIEFNRALDRDGRH